MCVLQEINTIGTICFENSFLKHTENSEIEKRALETAQTFCKIN